MLDIAGLGPKRVQTIYEELGVTTLEGLKEAAEQGQIAALYGLGEKTEQKILEDLEQWSEEDQQRTRIDVAEQVMQPLLEYMGALDDIQQIEVAGSYRRRKETVGDLDILAISDRGEEAISHFVNYEDVDEIVAQGDTRSTVMFRSGLQVDLRVVAEESYGAALLYFTGSKAHNITLRNMALEQRRKISEYGVFEGEEQITGQTEDELYSLFDLPWIPPERREDRGEIEAAQKGELPQLVVLEDLRGALQSHTTASDGRATLKEMARAAQKRGYDYLAITDHSGYIGVAKGMDAEELVARIDEIKQLNEEIEGIALLTGIEVDIMEDGSLDMPDDVLEKLDVVVFSVHSHFDLPRDKQTERIIRTMDNPNVNILAHPTGRRIRDRPPYDVDVEHLMDAALERGCFLEVNAQPARLDLNDVYCKMAKDRGLKLSIATDAHSTAELAFMRYGVDQARRGWLEPEDVLNTRTLDDLKALVAR
jgi:DNA polymerase (family 10)